jgi:alkylation response protein AidB-like acyl-CoA dehydrogenase
VDFSFTAEQDDLRRAVRDLAARRATSADVRRAMQSPTGSDAELWQVVVEQLGLPAIPVAERYAGLGGTWLDVAVVLEEGGRALMPVPLLATLTAAAVVQRCADDALAAEVLPAIAEGSQVAALALGAGVTAQDHRLTGAASHVLDGHVADVLLVGASEPDGDALWLVAASAPGVDREQLTTLDQTRRQAAYTFSGAVARRVGGAEAAADAVDLLRVALAVEAVGGARRCLEMTLDHLRTRVQFGRPIGSFQALKHRAADLAVALEGAVSAAYYAAWAAVDAPDELPTVAPLAKAVCCQAFYDIAAETIQLHGGIGFTWEHDAHLYFKRATSSRLLLGDTAAQRRVVAQRAGLAPGRVSDRAGAAR